MPDVRRRARASPRHGRLEPYARRPRGPGAPRALCLGDVARRRVADGDERAPGQYGFDLHLNAADDPFAIQWHEEVAAGNWATSITRTLPFQVPLGAFVPERIDGFIAAGKNIGRTHITNGALRLQVREE